MDLLRDVLPIVPTSPDKLGHGQGLKYNDKAYYYYGEEIPKDRIVPLQMEGSRKRARQWIVVAWDEDEEGFALIETVTNSLMHRMTRYKGLTPRELIVSMRMMTNEHQQRVPS